MNSRRVSILFLLPLTLLAQAPRDVAPLKYWSAPLYWQPTHAESRVAARSELFSVNSPQFASNQVGPSATGSPNALVFVAMTPCRLVDTRVGFGFSGAFGPPALVGAATRSFPLQTSTTCSIPTTAQAYSLNITIVPPGQMFYLTIWPFGSSQPTVSTQNDLLGTVIANAAIVPAGNDAGSGSVNVFVSNNTDLIIDINGYYAAPTDLNGNTALGAGTLTINTGINNTAAGASALQLNTTGQGNTADGAFALQHNTTGNTNTALGGGALYQNTTGAGNTAAGAGALQNNTTGNGNTGAGILALQANTTGSFNTATGTNSLFNNTTGSNNTASGDNAMEGNTTGCCNTASGQAALSSNTTGNSNAAFGGSALQNNTTASNNTAVGQASMLNTTTGCCNAALGQAALNANTTGSANVAIGGSALQNNTTASNNTAVGQAAMLNNSTGVNNTAVGNSALYTNIANGNTAVGVNAMRANTIGFQNTAIGLNSLQNNTSGNGSTAIGQGALGSATTGSSNIALGQGAAFNVVGGSNNIEIGSQGNAADNNTIRIGTPGTQASFVAAGVRGVTTGNNDAVPVVVDSNGQLGTVSSSLRFKEDVQDMADSSSGLLRLHPVTYRYKQPYADGSKPVDYGLIAEEVAEVYPGLVVKNADGQVETVQYQKLTPMLLNELQKQHQEMSQQKEQHDEEKAQTAEQIRLLQAEVAALKALLSNPSGR